MSLTITVRKVSLIIALTLAWCGLWRTFSFANVLSGLVISAAVVMSGVSTPGTGAIRVVPLLKLGWLVFVDLVSSTKEVATEILTPTDYTDEGVIAVELDAECGDHLLLLAVAITLTPGTAVVEVDPNNTTLYLHLLHIDQRDETVAHVHHLARLACEALPASRPTSSEGVSA